MSECKHGEYPALRLYRQQVAGSFQRHPYIPHYKECNRQDQKHPPVFQQHLPETIACQNKAEAAEECQQPEYESVPRHGI